MRCPARRNSSRSISPNGGPPAPAPSDAMSNLRDASARLGPGCFLDRIAHRECEGIRGGAIMSIGNLTPADVYFGRGACSRSSPSVIDQVADRQCQAAQGHRVDGLAEAASTAIE